MQLRGMPGLGRALALPVGIVAVALGALVVWWTLARDRAVGVAAVSLLAYGLYRLALELRVLTARRRRADDWLRSATGGFVPPEYAWRAAQLTSWRERFMLARTLRSIEQTALERPIGGFRPRLIAACRRRTSLEALANLLERKSEDVTPAGMLRVIDLVTDGGGPLWGTSEEALGRAIDSTLRTLSPASDSRRTGARAA